MKKTALRIVGTGGCGSGGLLPWALRAQVLLAIEPAQAAQSIRGDTLPWRWGTGGPWYAETSRRASRSGIHRVAH